jgi:hypothetical protein
MTIETFVKGLLVLSAAGLITGITAKSLEKSLPDKIYRGEITAEEGQAQEQVFEDLKTYGTLAGSVGSSAIIGLAIAGRRPRVGGRTYYHGR